MSMRITATPVTERPVSPLRRRMIEGMTIRNLSPATQRSYVHAVEKFSQYFGRSPARLGLDDVPISTAKSTIDAAPFAAHCTKAGLYSNNRTQILLLQLLRWVDIGPAWLPRLLAFGKAASGSCFVLFQVTPTTPLVAFDPQPLASGKQSGSSK